MPKLKISNTGRLPAGPGPVSSVSDCNGEAEPEASRMDGLAASVPLNDPLVAHTLRRLFSIAEVAEMFGRSPRTIRSWIEKGFLQRLRVGHAVFISGEQIDALLAQPRVATDPQNGSNKTQTL